MQQKFTIETSFYHYTIVGAGASGLWLAYAMLEQKILVNQTLCIVECDPGKTNDRTWCYWAEKPLSPLEIISKEWEFISNPQKTALSPFKYYHVRSADFYNNLKKTLQACPNVFWRMDKVEHVIASGNDATLSTSQSEWRTNFVFMSALPSTISVTDCLPATLAKSPLRPGGQTKTEVFLWQSFIGWRIKTDEPVFDESQMSMMQFNIAQNGNTQFMYVLPFSKSEALVEMTRFGGGKLTLKEAQPEIKQFLENIQCGYHILETETGAIPMTPAFDALKKHLPSCARIVWMGTVGGAIKPTTGYGFKRMHTYAYALAEALKYGRVFPTMYRPWRFRMYDKLLLHVLKEKPEQGKPVFERLFRTQPIQRILRFLDEETSLREEILIFYKLPVRLFLTYLVKQTFNR